MSSTAPGGPWSWQGSPFQMPNRCEKALAGGFPGGSFKGRTPGPHRTGQVKKLKFLEFNMLNLFERDFSLTDKNGMEGKDQKTEEQREGLARVIRTSDPDIMTWVEVENQKAAQLFSDKYLDGKYQVYLIDGNDGRGIDVAVLVKKDLPFEVEYRTMKDLYEGDPSQGEKVYSRDLPIAVFRPLEAGKAMAPQFVLMSTHFKSQRGDDGSFSKREQQARATAEVEKNLRMELGENVPIMLVGDYNNEVSSSPEFEAIRQVGFKDAFDLSPSPIPKDRRGTHYYFPKDGPPEFNQLDGFLISGRGPFQVVSASILPHLDSSGRPLPAPRSYKERETRPSDHLAIEVVMEF